MQDEEVGQQRHLEENAHLVALSESHSEWEAEEMSRANQEPDEEYREHLRYKRKWGIVDSDDAPDRDPDETIGGGMSSREPEELAREKDIERAIQLEAEKDEDDGGGHMTPGVL